MKRSVLQVLSLFMLLLLSCWGKQDNDIVKPNAPQYVFSGSVSDWYTGNALKEIKVVVEAKDLLYDVTFEPVEIYTDENGEFVVDPIYPGRFFVTLYRYGIALTRMNFQVEHGDEVRNYLLPSRFSVKKFKTNANILTGMPLAINNDTAIMWENSIKYYSYNTISWDGNGTADNPLGDTYISTITANDSVLFACQSPDTITAIGLQDVNVLNKYHITGVNLLGLALDKSSNTLWGCSKTMLVEFSQNPVTAVNVYTIGGVGFQAMAYYNQLYAFDNSLDACIRFDNELNITGYFVFIDNDDNTMVSRVTDMAFDKNGQLWVVPAE